MKVGRVESMEKVTDWLEGGWIREMYVYTAHLFSRFRHCFESQGKYGIQRWGIVKERKDNGKKVMDDGGFWYVKRGHSPDTYILNCAVYICFFFLRNERE